MGYEDTWKVVREAFWKHNLFDRERVGHDGFRHAIL